MKTIQIILIATLMVWFTSCNTEKSAEKKTITVLHFGGLANIKKMRATKERYEKTHPGVKIELIFPDGNVIQKYLSMAAAGTTPDIATLASGSMGDFASKGAVREMNDYIESHPYFVENIKPYLRPIESLEFLKFDGKYYGIPAFFNPVAMYANKSLFAEKGVSVPSGVVNREDIENLAKFADAASSTPIYPFSFSLDKVTTFQVISGNNLFNEDGSKVYIANAEQLEILRWQQKLFHKKVIPNIGITKDERAELFMTSRVMLQWGNHADKPVYSQASFDWDLVRGPKFKADAKNAMAVGVLVVKKDLKYQKEVFELLDEMLSGEYQKLVCTSKNEVPLLKKFQESELYTKAVPQITRPEIFIENLVNPFFGERYFTTEIMATYDNAYTASMIESADSITLEQSFKDAAAKIKGIIADKKKNGELAFPNY